MPKVALILTQGFADWEYALIAGTGGSFYGIDVQFFTPQPGSLRSQGGLVTNIEQDLNQCRQWQPDSVVVVGGAIWTDSQAPEIADFLKDCRADGASIGGICGGTLALARAGLLDTLPHTSNSRDFLIENAGNYAGASFYQDRPSAVSADGIITAPGTAPVSFTAAIFESVSIAPELISHFSAMLAAEHH